VRAFDRAGAPVLLGAWVLFGTLSPVCR